MSWSSCNRHVTLESVIGFVSDSCVNLVADLKCHPVTKCPAQFRLKQVCNFVLNLNLNFIIFYCIARGKGENENKFSSFFFCFFTTGWIDPVSLALPPSTIFLSVFVVSKSWWARGGCRCVAAISGRCVLGRERELVCWPYGSLPFILPPALMFPSFHSLCVHVYIVYIQWDGLTTYTRRPPPPQLKHPHTHTHPLAGREERLYTRYILISCENKCSSSRSGCFSFGLFPNFFFFARTSRYYIVATTGICVRISWLFRRNVYMPLLGDPWKNLMIFIRPLCLFSIGTNRLVEAQTSLAPPQIKMFEKRKE